MTNMSQISTLRFHKKVVLITGASGGVGQSIALKLAAEGADVALVDCQRDLLQNLAQRCNQFGGRSTSYTVNLLNETEIDGLKPMVLKDYSEIDILVHNAGIIALSPLLDAHISDFDRQYQCNVRAPFLLTQMFLPSLIARRGQIVFINSTAGLNAGRGVAQYAATKHALKALADSLRDEVNSQGVRVLSLYLGRTATPMQAKVHAFEGKTYQPERLIQPEQVASIMADALAMGREAEITEIRMRPMQKA
jgi:NADP-dependent 3-hydroxy acid dehydrogenase YdfG